MNLTCDGCDKPAPVVLKTAIGDYCPACIAEFRRSAAQLPRRNILEAVQPISRHDVIKRDFRRAGRPRPPDSA